MGSLRMAGPTASFVFLDFEATGLIGADKARSGRITEIAMMGVLRGEMEVATASPRAPPPRMRSQLLLPVYPGPDAEWSPRAMEITGLSEELMRESSTLAYLWPNCLNFLRSLPKPLVLIAHNGDRFDFPLLRDEMKRCELKNLPDGVFTVDSLDLFRYADMVEAELIDILDHGEPYIKPTSTVSFDKSNVQVLSDPSLPGNTGGDRVHANDSTPKGKGEGGNSSPPPRSGKKNGESRDGTPEPSTSKTSNNSRRRLFPPSPVRSYALGEIHKRACPGKAFNDAHQAMGDVQALLDVFISYGFPVLQMVDQMRKPFPAV